MIEPAILEKFEALPDSLKAEVAHYIEFLLDKHLKTESSQQNEVKKPHGYGVWAGQIVMSEDFDEPLEDLKDYM
ncbi:DUF2281 domain-containing protein [Leptolyngbya boryana CZ1]|uniref:DUF2281 domain-containing protein n=1 Tax=Leptolyngbya boryana CZ1 TaxID=3060204 RepID=A0AA97ATT9_LEPBY|nr:DUF2281 domain-containing protein [Leptolyngbya boryana]WNZ43571.1 DUF2281 domain-containing protein [Leptolyngbya boryana CZ1]